MREGWQRLPLGRVAFLDIDRVTVERQGNYAVAGVLNAGNGLFPRERINGSATNYPALYRLHTDQLVMRKLTAWEGPITTVGEAYDGFFVSPEFPTFRLDRNVLEPAYMRLVCQTPQLWEAMKNTSTGTVQRRKRVSPSALLSIEIDLPPLQEQRRIVDLISAVDAEIASAQYVTRTVASARSSLLNELLAGGEDWTATTLGNVADFYNGYPFKPFELTGQGKPVVRIRQLLDPAAELDLSDIPVPIRHHIDDGDLIFSWSGTLASQIWKRGPALLNQHLFRVVERPGVLRGWLHLALDHAIKDLNKKTHGTTMKHLTKKVLEGHQVLVPPLPEQRQIVDIIQTLGFHLTEAHRLVKAGEVARASLLSDLLTGAHEIPESYDVLLETT